MIPSPRTSELAYPVPPGGAVVFGVSAARAVGVLLSVAVVVAGGGGVDLGADEGGGEEEEEETDLVSRESAVVGIEDTEDEDGEDITDGRIVVAFAIASGVDTVCIVVDWICAFTCADPL